jgi:hypothetical protein
MRIEEYIAPAAVAGDHYAPPQMQMLDNEP